MLTAEEAKGRRIFGGLWLVVHVSLGGVRRMSREGDGSAMDGGFARRETHQQ